MPPAGREFSTIFPVVTAWNFKLNATVILKEWHHVMLHKLFMLKDNTLLPTNT